MVGGWSSIKKLLPGLAILFIIGGVGRVLSLIVDINYLILAIAIGIVITNTVGLPKWAKKGVETRKIWLETGIILMGSRLTIDVVFRSGPKILGVVSLMVGFTVILAELFARRLFFTEEKLGSLLAAGSGICGVSAIIAVAGSIRAKEQQIGYAVATILLFDAVTVFLYPLLGTVLHLSPQKYGVWAGVSMFSTGPVVAAGFAQSEAAGQWATVTKIARNLFIAFVAITYSFFYTQRGEEDIGQALWSKFPKFVIGFIAMVIIASSSLLSSKQLTSLENAYNWLFLFAFAGLGLTITVDDLKDTGGRPVLLVILVFSILSLVSLAVVSVLFS